MLVKNINSLWTVYLTAIFLIAVFITMFFVISEYKQQSSLDNEAIINIAGRQRMLSQRLALFTNLHLNAGAEETRYESIVKNDLELFEASHNALLHGSESMKISNRAAIVAKDIYFGDMRLDRLVQRYIALIREALDTQSLDNMAAINVLAEDELLQYLDDVVNKVENYAYEQNIDLIFYERIFYLMALFLLIFELLFIYRPSFNFLVKYDRDLKCEKQKLESVNQELEQFAYRTSHDFRSPVISNISLLELSRKFIDDNNKEALRSSTNSVIKSLKSIEHLINEVITITLIQKQKEQPESFNVKELVQNIIDDVSGFEGVGELEIDNDCDDFTLINKKRHLKIAIFNLLTNSIKYRNPENKNGYIRISAIKNDEYAIIKVVDNGLGIPEQYQHKMFEMFQRFHPTISYGSGLGLYIIKTSVAALNGTIKFSQKPETCFEIRIPVAI